jgi:hypothetical protein
VRKEIVMKRIVFFMFMCLLVAPPAFAGFVNLPETGQTKCYLS